MCTPRAVCSYMGGGIIEGVFGFIDAFGSGDPEWITNKVCWGVRAGHPHT